MVKNKLHLCECYLCAERGEEIVHLRAAAQKVLNGLQHRMSYAGQVKAPVPVFEGIADLVSALSGD